MNLRRAAFLDRDGTIIEDTGFVRDAAGVTLIPGSAEAVRRLNEAIAQKPFWLPEGSQPQMLTAIG